MRLLAEPQTELTRGPAAAQACGAGDREPIGLRSRPQGPHRARSEAAAHEYVVHVVPVEEELLGQDPSIDEALGLVEPAGRGVVAEDPQGDAQRRPGGGPPRRPRGAGPGRRPAPRASSATARPWICRTCALRDERGREAEPDIADDAAVELRDQVVAGAEPLVEERLVRRLGPGLTACSVDQVSRSSRPSASSSSGGAVRMYGAGMAVTVRRRTRSVRDSGTPAGVFPGHWARMGPMETFPNRGGRRVRPHRQRPGAVPDRRRTRGGAAGAPYAPGAGRGELGPASGSTSTRPGSSAATPWSTSPGPGSATAAGRTRTSGRSATAGCSARPTLAEAVASLDEPPRVFVNGSAMGIYGDTGERARGRERAARRRASCPRCASSGRRRRRPREEAGVRTVFARTGPGGGREGRRLGAALPAVQGGSRRADGRRPAVLELHRAARPRGRAAASASTPSRCPGRST